MKTSLILLALTVMTISNADTVDSKTTTSKVNKTHNTYKHRKPLLYMYMGDDSQVPQYIVMENGNMEPIVDKITLKYPMEQ